jgi:hypothetical protein
LDDPRTVTSLSFNKLLALSVECSLDLRKGRCGVPASLVEVRNITKNDVLHN